MQHSTVDLENYARLYVEDKLRDAARRQRANEVVTGVSLLGRTMARLQAWFTPAAEAGISHSPAQSQPAHLVPMVKKTQPAAEPYAGMIVLVRGPRDSCTVDAA